MHCSNGSGTAGSATSLKSRSAVRIEGGGTPCCHPESTRELRLTPPANPQELRDGAVVCPSDKFFSTYAGMLEALLVARRQLEIVAVFGDLPV
jgi:hypothetical protein